MSAANALQGAIHARLIADAGCKAVLGDPVRLFDRTPATATFPFATHHRIETRTNDAALQDGAEHVVTLHVYSRHGGAQEARAALEAMRASLHRAPLTLTGHLLVLLLVTFADVLRIDDGRTFQGVLRLKAVTEPL